MPTPPALQRNSAAAARYRRRGWTQPACRPMPSASERWRSPRCSSAPGSSCSARAQRRARSKRPPDRAPDQGATSCRSGLIQPERVEPDHVVDAEIIFWIVALHVVVPDIEDIFPCDRYQRRILLHEVLSSPNQRQTLAGIDFDV